MMFRNLRLSVFGICALYTVRTHTFWRMGCPGRLVLGRVDPIASPGAASGHVHTVSGGNGFGFTTSYEQLRASTCSSCPITQDLSAYWTPKLYYIAQDGTYQDVPQAGEGGTSTGGMTVYYQQRPGKQPGSSTEEKIEAFPPGLRMLAGDPLQRNATGLQAAPGEAVSFVCLDYNGKSDQTTSMANNTCPDGLRAQIYFPSCWDGTHNDTADHRSHMAYPIGHFDNGYCPDTHPVHLVSIFYEVIYSTANFEWYSDEQPFVFAQGDRTGYGFHGDFVNGWDTQALQDAIDTCTSLSGTLEDCPVFKQHFTDQQCQSCRLQPALDETLVGNLTQLPGCNAVTSGPAYAPPSVHCAGSDTPVASPTSSSSNALSDTPASTSVRDSSVTSSSKSLPTTTTTPASTPSSTSSVCADVAKSLGWSYQSCGTDVVSQRTFQGALKMGNDMTVETCVLFCDEKGFALAGLEYGGECYCDNNYLTASRAPQPDITGDCTMPCTGSKQQICGGKVALSVYRTAKALRISSLPD